MEKTEVLKGYVSIPWFTNRRYIAVCTKGLRKLILVPNNSTWSYGDEVEITIKKVKNNLRSKYK